MRPNHVFILFRHPVLNYPMTSRRRGCWISQAFTLCFLFIAIGPSIGLAQGQRTFFLNTFMRLRSDGSTREPLEAVKLKTNRIEQTAEGERVAVLTTPKAKSNVRYQEGEELRFVVRAFSKKGPQELIQFCKLAETDGDRTIRCAIDPAGKVLRLVETGVAFQHEELGDGVIRLKPVSPLGPGEYFLSTREMQNGFAFGIDGKPSPTVLEGRGGETPDPAGSVVSRLTPGESEAKRIIEEEIQRQAAGRIRLISFKQLSASDMEIQKVKFRSLDFEAEIEFTADCSWGTVTPQTGSWGGEFITNSRIPKDFLEQLGQLPTVVMRKGQHAVVRNTVGFQKTDSGWKGQSTGNGRLIKVSGERSR